MLSVSSVVFSVFLATVWSAEDLSFPPGFKFGVASSAYQIEGAWNVSDKAESIWDHFTHQNPSPLSNGDTADVACDSYRLWREDIRMVEEIGADFYRISISWTRLLPNGFADHVSEDGKRYYSDLIDGLLEKGIEPVVTLYQFDMPQKLQDLGGWTNPLIADWFAEYARVAYSLYGDRVKTWITVNEPWVICDIPYLEGIFPPRTPSQVGTYLCSKNVIMAHAKAWRVYDEEFKPQYHGAVSLTNQNVWYEAANETDEETAELVREFQAGRFCHPIYSKEGGWPPAVEKALAEYSEKEGYPWSVLPAFTKAEIEFVKGTYDFFGLNFYIARRVRKVVPGKPTSPRTAGEPPAFNAKIDFDPSWPVMMSFFTYYPESFRKELVWLKQHYGDIPILITENGRGTTGGLDDQERIDFYRNYLKQMLLAIKEDGVNVTAYTAWALMDNFEWTAGYGTKFGLYEVDFTSPNRTRTARSSAKFYASVIENRSLDVPYNFTHDVAPKSSITEESNADNIIFGVVVLVLILVVLAAFVGCHLRKRAKLQKKHQYAAVNNGDHRSAQNGDNNGAQNGNQHGAHTGNRNGTQNGNGTTVLINGQNGVDEANILLT